MSPRTLHCALSFVGRCLRLPTTSTCYLALALKFHSNVSSKLKDLSLRACGLHPDAACFLGVPMRGAPGLSRCPSSSGLLGFPSCQTPSQALLSLFLGEGGLQQAAHRPAIGVWTSFESHLGLNCRQQRHNVLGTNLFDFGFTGGCKDHFVFLASCAIVHACLAKCGFKAKKK